MGIGRGLLAAGAVLALLAGGAARADEPVAVTQQQMRAGGTALAYATEVGRIPIADVATGEPHGFMGYIAYRIPSKDGTPRPLTFVWNGGPGSNSTTLHFEVVGPYRGEGTALVANAETWLAFTDLVFVDPIGTGFSRPAKAEYAEEFYGTVGDVASVTEFVRAWRIAHQAEAAPTWLAGESWGAGRAASVAHGLLARGSAVEGLILISGGSGLRDVGPPRALATALRAADWAQAALAHGKLGVGLPGDPEALRLAAEAWARETYAPALERIEQLSPAERDQVAAELSGFIGLPAEAIDRATLTVSPRQYREGLLKDQGKTLYVFDLRRTDSGDGDFDPAILRYIRHDLNYPSPLPYVGLEPWAVGYAPGGQFPASVGERWNYATAPVTEAEMQAAIAKAIKEGGGPPQLGPPLPGTAEAVALDPSLKVLVAAGWHDSLNSCAANREIEARLTGPVGQAVSFRCYVGGHMFYRDQPSRLAFSRDVRALIEGR